MVYFVLNHLLCSEDGVTLYCCFKSVIQTGIG